MSDGMQPSVQAMRAGAGCPLVDSVVVLTVDPKSFTRSGLMGNAPLVVGTLPVIDVDGYSIDDSEPLDPKDAALFAFPGGARLRCRFSQPRPADCTCEGGTELPPPPSTLHMFVLTGATGFQRYGYCFTEWAPLPNSAKAIVRMQVGSGWMSKNSAHLSEPDEAPTDIEYPFVYREPPDSKWFDAIYASPSEQDPSVRGFCAACRGSLNRYPESLRTLYTMPVEYCGRFASTSKIPFPGVPTEVYAPVACCIISRHPLHDFFLTLLKHTFCSTLIPSTLSEILTASTLAKQALTLSCSAFNESSKTQLLSAQILSLSGRKISSTSVGPCLNQNEQNATILSHTLRADGSWTQELKLLTSEENEYTFKSGDNLSTAMSSSHSIAAAASVIVTDCPLAKYTVPSHVWKYGVVAILPEEGSYCSPGPTDTLSPGSPAEAQLNTLFQDSTNIPTIVATRITPAAVAALSALCTCPAPSYGQAVCIDIITTRPQSEVRLGSFMNRPIRRSSLSETLYCSFLPVYFPPSPYLHKAFGQSYSMDVPCEALGLTLLHNPEVKEGSADAEEKPETYRIRAHACATSQMAPALQLLLASIPPKAIIKLISVLVQDLAVIVVDPDPLRVALASLAVRELLDPIEWRYPCIPLAPMAIHDDLANSIGAFILGCITLPCIECNFGGSKGQENIAVFPSIAILDLRQGTIAPAAHVMDLPLCSTAPIPFEALTGPDSPPTFEEIVQEITARENDARRTRGTYKDEECSEFTECADVILTVYDASETESVDGGTNVISEAISTAPSTIKGASRTSGSMSESQIHDLANERLRELHKAYRDQIDEHQKRLIDADVKEQSFMDARSKERNEARAHAGREFESALGILPIPNHAVRKLAAALCFDAALYAVSHPNHAIGTCLEVAALLSVEDVIDLTELAKRYSLGRKPRIGECLRLITKGRMPWIVELVELYFERTNGNGGLMHFQARTSMSTLERGERNLDPPETPPLTKFHWKAITSQLRTEIHCAEGKLVLDASSLLETIAPPSTETSDADCLPILEHSMVSSHLFQRGNYLKLTVAPPTSPASQTSGQELDVSARSSGCSCNCSSAGWISQNPPQEMLHSDDQNDGSRQLRHPERWRGLPDCDAPHERVERKVFASGGGSVVPAAYPIESHLARSLSTTAARVRRTLDFCDSDSSTNQPSLLDAPSEPQLVPLPPCVGVPDSIAEMDEPVSAHDSLQEDTFSSTIRDTLSGDDVLLACQASLETDDTLSILSTIRTKSAALVSNKEDVVMKFLKLGNGLSNTLTPQVKQTIPANLNIDLGAVRTCVRNRFFNFDGTLTPMASCKSKYFQPLSQKDHLGKLKAPPHRSKPSTSVSPNDGGEERFPSMVSKVLVSQENGSLGAILDRLGLIEAKSGPSRSGSSQAQSGDLPYQSPPTAKSGVLTAEIVNFDEPREAPKTPADVTRTSMLMAALTASPAFITVVERSSSKLFSSSLVSGLVSSILARNSEVVERYTVWVDNSSTPSASGESLTTASFVTDESNSAPSSIFDRLVIWSETPSAKRPTPPKYQAYESVSCNWGMILRKLTGNSIPDATEDGETMYAVLRLVAHLACKAQLGQLNWLICDATVIKPMTSDDNCVVRETQTSNDMMQNLLRRFFRTREQNAAESRALEHRLDETVASGEIALQTFMLSEIIGCPGFRDVERADAGCRPKHQTQDDKMSPDGHQDTQGRVWFTSPILACTLGTGKADSLPAPLSPRSSFLPIRLRSALAKMPSIVSHVRGTSRTKAIWSAFDLLNLLQRGQQSGPTLYADSARNKISPAAPKLSFDGSSLPCYELTKSSDDGERKNEQINCRVDSTNKESTPQMRLVSSANSPSLLSPSPHLGCEIETRQDDAVHEEVETLQRGIITYYENLAEFHDLIELHINRSGGDHGILRMDQVIDFEILGCLRRVKAALADLWANLIGHHTECYTAYVEADSNDAPVLRFNRDKFLSMVPRELRPFMKTVVRTQNFTSYIEKHETARSDKATIQALEALRNRLIAEQKPHDATLDNACNFAAILLTGSEFDWKVAAERQLVREMALNLRKKCFSGYLYLAIHFDQVPQLNWESGGIMSSKQSIFTVMSAVPDSDTLTETDLNTELNSMYSSVFSPKMTTWSRQYVTLNEEGQVKGWNTSIPLEKLVMLRNLLHARVKHLCKDADLLEAAVNYQLPDVLNQLNRLDPKWHRFVTALDAKLGAIRTRINRFLKHVSIYSLPSELVVVNGNYTDEDPLIDLLGDEDIVQALSNSISEEQMTLDSLVSAGIPKIPDELRVEDQTIGQFQWDRLDNETVASLVTSVADDLGHLLPNEVNQTLRLLCHVDNALNSMLSTLQPSWEVDLRDCRDSGSLVSLLQITSKNGITTTEASERPPPNFHPCTLYPFRLNAAPKSLRNDSSNNSFSDNVSSLTQTSRLHPQSFSNYESPGLWFCADSGDSRTTWTTAILAHRNWDGSTLEEHPPSPMSNSRGGLERNDSNSSLRCSENDALSRSSFRHQSSIESSSPAPSALIRMGSGNNIPAGAWRRPSILGSERLAPREVLDQCISALRKHRRRKLAHAETSIVAGLLSPSARSRVQADALAISSTTADENQTATTTTTTATTITTATATATAATTTTRKAAASTTRVRTAPWASPWVSASNRNNVGNSQVGHLFPILPRVPEPGDRPGLNHDSVSLSDDNTHP